MDTTWSPKRWPLSGRTSGPFLSPNCGVTFFPHIAGQKQVSIFRTVRRSKWCRFCVENLIPPLCPLCRFLCSAGWGRLKVGLWEPVARPVSESVCFYVSLRRLGFFLGFFFCRAMFLWLCFRRAFCVWGCDSLSIDQRPTERHGLPTNLID